MNRSRCELFFSFSLFLYRWEEISKSLSLGIFILRIRPKSFVEIQFSDPPKSSLSFFLKVRTPCGLQKSSSLSLLFSYLNETVSWETFHVLPSLMMNLLAILFLRWLWPSVVLSHPWDGPPNF